VIFCEAGPDDVPVLLTLIRELAAFERAPDAVKMSEAQLHEGLFGPEALAEALLVKIDGVPQAMAIWGRSFNTWTGRPGMAIEDVYVREACRGRGVGKAIFAHLAGLAVQRGYLRVDWQVLDWNETAIRFYDALGAQAQPEWLKYRLSGAALQAAANQGAK